MPACMRSILAPHRVISIRVGIRVASKQMKKDRMSREEKVRIKKNIIWEVRRRNPFWLALDVFLTFF